MGIVELGRSGSMRKYYKDENVKDIMRLYFNHPVWKMKSGDALPDAPLDIQIEFLNTCNLHCSACDYDDQRRTKTSLDWQVLSRLVDEAAEEGVAYFTICGLGEATLHRDIFRFFRYVRDTQVAPKGLRQLDFMPTVMISNGMWSSTQIANCIENPPDLISFSLAGLSDEEIIERRKPLNLDRFREVVGRLYRERKVLRRGDGGLSPTIHISTHIYPHEMVTREDDIKRFVDEWHEVSDIVVIKPTMLLQHRPDIQKFATEQAGFDGDETLRYTDLTEDRFERTAPCFETSRRLSINSDGDVWCGHHLSEDFGDFLGNVKQQSIREIWHGPLMNEFRRDVRAGKFDREACRMCGGEIRDVHRMKEAVKEQVLRFETGGGMRA